MKPYIIRGGEAFPQFRMEALVGRLGMAPSDLTAQNVYLLDLKRSLEVAEVAVLAAVLGLDGCNQDITLGENTLFVAPRKGTISVWSSRATDILHGCGLRVIKRIERSVLYTFSGVVPPPQDYTLLCDRMREGVYRTLDDIFEQQQPAPGRVFDLLTGGIAILEQANHEMGLALSDDEIEYLYNSFKLAGRNPTDTELVMFAQVNSEHCRHKIFNADWIVDGQKRERTLFQMIRHTHACHPAGTLVAYKDNASVMQGFHTAAIEVNRDSQKWHLVDDQIDIVMKAETHNHPTAISPYPGASTGVGGEIRDEVATGTGARSKAGLSGIIVSNLHVPGFEMLWEKSYAPFPARMATPLAIMLEGPMGGASFGNEFGRPQLCGFFRTYEELVNGAQRGYHKPILMAGGMGNIRRSQVYKKAVVPGSLIVQLGGPSMLIGLGGGAASSGTATGSQEAGLDYDSVQRGNAEVERRCQEVIEACVALGADNPILSIHDVGAGGLSNACPELVEKSGATFELRAVPCAEPGMSPMQIWCCESQERYVLAIAPASRGLFEEFCKRERCPYAFIGVARDDQRLVLNDSLFNNSPIDMDIRVLLGKPPRMLRDVKHEAVTGKMLDFTGVVPLEAFERVLQLPAVADKTFLISGTDRSVTGLVHRDQLVGRYQLPVADCAVTVTGFLATTGEAMATGERTPVALIDAPASGRMAVAEALQNLAGANIGEIGNIKLSANWMAACGESGEDARLYDTVSAVGIELCPQLGISIPVGKDSLSMRTVWRDTEGNQHKQTAPLSLIVSSFATVKDVRKTVTPDLKQSAGKLLLIDLGRGRNRLGASALAQVYNQTGDVAPNVDEPQLVKSFFNAMQELVENEALLAFHDRSDGGVVVTLAEMAMAGGYGLEVTLPDSDVLSALFNEELGGVVQVADEKLEAVLEVLQRHGLESVTYQIGKTLESRAFNVTVDGRAIITTNLTWLRRTWSGLSCRMQALRDNPLCAWQEYDNALDENDPGMRFKLTFNPEQRPEIGVAQAPRIALLRDQGGNGHAEMAAALLRAGFSVADVHITDLQRGRTRLADFVALAIGAGFTYGDALGAAQGWAQTILQDGGLADKFREFFTRPETLSFGVGNGAQLLARLKGVIPGSEAWPLFGDNLSDRFESRYVTVEVLDSPSPLFKGMVGCTLPIPVAHAQGRPIFTKDADARAVLTTLRYVDNYGELTERYPYNPSGAVGGQAGYTTRDGRVTILMPHPERAFRAMQLSYRPKELFTGEVGPWLRLFDNAFEYVAKKCIQSVMQSDS